MKIAPCNRHLLIEIFEENTECIPGDLNQDLSINIQDIVSMINLIVGDISGSELEQYLCSGDLNNDSIINVQDIILLVGLILN